MSGRSKVDIESWLAREPESRQTAYGKLVSLVVALGEKWKDKRTGQERETGPFWTKIVVYDERLATYAATLKKGDSVVITGGQLETQRYTAKDGVEKTDWRVVLKKSTSFRPCDINGYLAGEQTGQVADAPEKAAKDREFAESLDRNTPFDDKIPF